jgi:hypothetical protein
VSLCVYFVPLCGIGFLQLNDLNPVYGYTLAGIESSILKEVYGVHFRSSPLTLSAGLFSHVQYQTFTVLSTLEWFAGCPCETARGGPSSIFDAAKQQSRHLHALLWEVSDTCFLQGTFGLTTRNW